MEIPTCRGTMSAPHKTRQSFSLSVSQSLGDQMFRMRKKRKIRAVTEATTPPPPSFRSSNTKIDLEAREAYFKVASCRSLLIDFTPETVYVNASSRVLERMPLDRDQPS